MKIQGVFEGIDDDGNWIVDGRTILIDDDTEITTYISTDVTKKIQDFKTITSTLTVPDSHSILDVDVQLNIKHTWDAVMEVFRRA